MSKTIKLYPVRALDRGGVEYVTKNDPPVEIPESTLSLTGDPEETYVITQGFSRRQGNLVKLNVIGNASDQTAQTIDFQFPEGYKPSDSAYIPVYLMTYDNDGNDVVTLVLASYTGWRLSINLPEAASFVIDYTYFTMDEMPEA